HDFSAASPRPRPAVATTVRHHGRITIEEASMTTTDHTDETCETAFDRMRGSAMARALGLIGLILLLQVPIEMISSTINERSTRRNEAITDVTRTWGHRQEVRG